MPLTFFDVETPNRRQDKICSIGVIRLDDSDQVEYRLHTYVDPEAPFDYQNTQIHGIACPDVSGYPTFDNLWKEELRSVFSDSIVVAHNASFDLRVMDKTLSSYGEIIDPLDYLCTKRAAEICELDAPDYTLPSLCRRFGIELGTHHDAMCDATACMELFRAMRQDCLIDLFSVSTYQHAPYALELAQTPDDNASTAMTDLYGITLGVAFDGHVTAAEHSAFGDWMDRYAGYRTHPFFREIYGLLYTVLEDGVVTTDERDALLNFTRPFVQDKHNRRSTVAMQELIGIVRGIGADRQVNEAEAANLKAWMTCNHELHGDKVFKRVYNTVSDAIADGIIKPEEEAVLLESFDSLINPVKESESTIDLCGKKVCLTGDFLAGSKKIVAQMVADKGGEVIKNVTKKCDVVVVGGKGSEQYAFGNYGTKVKTAMEYQDAGLPIQIVQEVDLDL